MTATAPTVQNLIASEFVAGSTGETEPILNPATGEVIAHAPLSSVEDVNRAVDAADAAFDEWADDDPRRARARAAEARRRDRGARRRARRARVRQRRQADRRDARRRDPVHGRQPALLRGRGACAPGPDRRRVPERLHLDDPPRAGRRDRPDLPLELPADDGRLEDRPGARGRQHGRAEARRDDSALDPEACRNRRRVPARRACST